MRVGIQIDLSDLDKLVSPYKARQAYSRGLNTLATRAIFLLNREVHEVYETPEPVKRYAKRIASRQHTLRSEVLIRYAPHPLSWFPVKQVRLTVGGRKLFVKKPKKSGGAVSRSRSRTTYTRVKVFKAGGYKLVHGTLGFMGWYHKETNMIYERNQQSTWYRGRRLPYHALFGPSISQMAANPKVQEGFDKALSTETAKVGKKFFDRAWEQ